MFPIRKCRSAVLAYLALVLVFASSALAGSYHYAQGYWPPGTSGSSTYSYSWYYNIFWTQSEGQDKTVTFIDATDGYRWKATVRNTSTDTITKYYSPDHYKKAYCLANSGPANYGVCSVTTT